MADEALVEALRAVAGGEPDAAVAAAEAAEPSSLLGPALVRFLRSRSGDVYEEPTAFERFIDGGGNVALYEAAGRALASVHAAARPRTVLDVGCGEGRLTAAAVREGLERIDLVEPSAELLERARRRLDGDGAEVVPHGLGAEAFVAGIGDQRWDLVQSTFALHTMAPEARAGVLSALAGATDHLCIAEFDVPALTDRGDDHVRYLAERYERGLAEYAADGDDVVAQGFLLPVLVAQLDPARPRHTWEQPATAWADELGAAGFTTVERHHLRDYWWAPAVLLEARR